MPRKVLIVDDNDINRIMLRTMLQMDYDVLEAENGEEALSILNSSYKMLSAVLLDIVMPVMDGYEVLRRMHKNPVLSQIPVIVTTGSTDGDTEIEALKLGANDFITKPYIRDIIKHRLRNTINLRETAATVNALQRDRLTNLFTREAFFQRADAMIHERPAGYYVMACFDIDSFKVINDQYGSDMGDEVLRRVASTFQSGFDAEDGLVGRITADNFAVLYPVSFMNSEKLAKIREDASILDGIIPPISFTIGRYIVDDLSLPVSAMYDRAALAAASVKGRFDNKIALYDESMLEQLIHDQTIVSEMKKALVQKQFEIWLQPQFNHSSGALIGAEALARWRHPSKGLIPPGVFIPIFERNGFVYELDKYVWEHTCELLKQWIDDGIEPLPVSVNVSRYDVFRDDLIDFISSVTERYAIPKDLLRLEITETAFAQSTDRIIKVVKSLIDNGFTVEIDDFGSGYSSLNTLKDVPAQIVKLDMRFLKGGDASGRGGSILESIVRMTKWLGMAVIAEGVETIEQADYLKSIGCNYVQGYLYAKPMPEEQYAALVKSIGKEEKLLVMETVENLDNNAFWDPESMDTLIFNTYVGGACIFEWHNNKIEILRANEKYAQIIGGEKCTVEDALNLKWEEHMDEAAAKATYDAIDRAIETGEEATYEAVYFNLFGSPDETYLRTTFRVIARTTDRYLLYATNINLTAQRRAEIEKNRAAMQLRVIMDNISGGVTAVAVREGVPVILFANEQFYAMLGFTKEEFDREIDNPHILTHPDDRDMVERLTKWASLTRQPATIVYRVLPRDGSVRWWQSNITIMEMDDVDEPVQLSVANDVTALREAEQRERETAGRMQAIMDNASSGITAVVLKGDDVEFLFANDRYYEINGYTREQYAAEVTDTYALAHPDDRDWVIEAIKNANEIGKTTTLEYRVIRRDGKVVWVRAVISTRMVEGTDYPAQFAIFTDITAEKNAQLQINSLNESLQNMMNDMPGGFVRLRVNPDGPMNIDYVNENFCLMRGLAYDEIMNADVIDASQTIHPDDRESVLSIMNDAIATGETRNIPYRLKRGDGKYMMVNAFGRVSKNEAGETFINVYYTDLSEQEKQEYSIRETMPLILSAIMKSSTASVFAKNKDLRYICCSPTFLRMAGRNDVSEIIGKTDYELFPKETADLFHGTDMKLLEGNEPLIDYTEPIPSNDGSKHYAQTSKYLLRDAAGDIIGVYGTGRDITEERTAYEQLKLLTNSIPGGIATYEISPDKMKLTYFNDGFCNLFGYTREEYAEISSTGITNLTYEEDIPDIMAQIQALCRDGTPLDCFYRVHTKGGGLKWVNSRGAKTEQIGDVCYINLVVLDVTEAKLAEDAARIHEQEMRLAIAQMGRMLCEYSPITHTLTVPEDFAVLYNVPAKVPDVPESLIQSGTITEDTLPAFRAFYDAILAGEKTGVAEYCDRRQDGSLHWERVEFSSVFDSENKPVKALISVEDTTELHERFEMERRRPMMGEENLIGRGLFNLSNGGEVLEYFDRYGELVPEERQLVAFNGENRLDDYIFDPAEREKFDALHNLDFLLDRYAKGETEHSIEYRRKRVNGDITWVRNDLRLVARPGSGDIMLFEYGYSIEEEKMLDMMYRSLVNESYDYVARINATNGHFNVITNTALKRGSIPPQSGTNVDEVVREKVSNFCHPEDREMVLKNTLVEGIVKNLESAERFQFTCRMFDFDGSTRYKRITQYYLDRSRGIIILTREDITDLMREEMRKNEMLEAALVTANEESRVKERKSAARLKAIMNNVDGGMSAATLIDGEIGYLFVNDAYYSMFGYTKEQFESELPRGLVDLIHPDDLQMVYDMADESVVSGTERMEFRVRKRDGEYIWVRSISSTCELEDVDSPVHLAVLIDISKEREIEDNLRISEEQFRIAATIGGRRTARYDIKSKTYHHSDDVLLELGFGKSVENVPEAFIEAGCLLPESVEAYREFYEKIKRGEKNCSADVAILLRDGIYRWMRGDAVVIFDSAGKPSQAIIVFTDISEQREKEAVYIKWQQSLQQRPKQTYTLFRCNLSKNASFDITDGSLLNAKFGPEAKSFDERTQEYVDQSVYPDDRDDYIAFIDSDALLAGYYRGNRMLTHEYRESQPDGIARWRRLTVELVEYPNSTDVEAFLMFEDIDKEKREELLNKERAETDPLTGILNRNAFVQTVENMIADTSATHSLALMMLDIDGFKLINDTFGHVVGDQVLMDIAASLRGALRSDDVVGRLGGDEFVICIRNMPDDEAISRKAGQICALLRRALSLEVYMSASIGIAIYPRDGRDFETLYRKMDIALYVVKGHGKNNYAFFHDNMNDDFAQHDQIDSGTDIIARIKQSKRRRILIVDDNLVSITMLKRMFEDEFIVETAKDGNEALICLRRYGVSIAVVLLDLVMPGMDGFAVLEKMRTSAEMQTIPVVVVSGMDEYETGLRVIKCGATDFVTKPVNPELLRLRVKSAISKAENDRLRSQNSILLMHNTQTAKYRAALVSVGAAVVEYEPKSGVFFYDHAIANMLDGVFDNRDLWDILALDNAASAKDIKRIRDLVEEMARDESRAGSSVTAKLRTPSGQRHVFRVHVNHQIGEANSFSRIILAFVDVSAMYELDGESNVHG